MSLSLFLISFLTIKNQCTKISNEITAINKSVSKNTSIVKELQSKKEYYISSQYISSAVEGKMIAIVPEPQIITINNE